MSAVFQVEAVLHSAIVANPHEHDVLAHALNERFVELDGTIPSPIRTTAPLPEAHGPASRDVAATPEGPASPHREAGAVRDVGAYFGGYTHQVIAALVERPKEAVLADIRAGLRRFSDREPDHGSGQ